MAQFKANATRLDPYKNFKFKVYFGDAPDPVAGVSKVSGLKKTTEVVSHREGGDPSTSHKSPGRTEYEAITLERGVTHDPAFEAWANKTRDVVSLADFRKEIRIVLFNEAGQAVKAYKVTRCWVSEYNPLPELDANANAVAIESIKIENEGWEIDDAVTEQKEEAIA